ncbi:UDP-3-O-(3-hydroxymyristoyl)glucosamine N-acyltransferase [Geitlerinema sp. P-1104]|uniref:UDP-3-O-(3-hydroxymyristoyl)glucosamine N-acyltransferase n=1 Tax=Geitlerinema sp. P-1104 TaxID=2546230 RepID=UPI001477844E|nr:UDP-3-O-(3-hydroxymyristoyl)glucosamine N-acyltransferase [Geitlerinema sp. P-1104]NMG57859.1 UDP-3-O-(3-hydroxymyristoyl)glucosamine N-acyltransferase [Geitlerinema sp. P-1104]
MNFSELVAQLAEAGVIGSFSADAHLDIVNVAAIEEAETGSLSFIEGDSYANYLQSTRASAVILPDDELLQQQAQERGIAWISSASPKALFADAISLFYQPYRPAPGRHPTAIIHESATLGANVSVGAHVVIDANVDIGDDVCIAANVVLYPGVIIGDRSYLHANCTIHERTQIGVDCIIQSGVVLGAEGFGFVPSASGLKRMEQSGCVVIEAGVEIGCNSTVDRPAVGETRIGANTKIDNLVQIGHGCRIGKNCAICAQVGLAGGVTLGDGVTLAGQVGVANRAKIGAGATASAKTGIHRDVKAGALVSGFPAIDNALWRRSAALYKRLPEFYQSLRQIQQRLNQDS